MTQHQASRTRVLGVLVITWTITGCATSTPYVGRGPNPQIVRGHPCPPIDALGNVFALPTKLVLWNWRVDNHAISAQTEEVLAGFLRAHHDEISGSEFRLNVWSPTGDIKRLATNHHVAWPYRATLGTLTVIMEILLPGRLFAGLLGGDAYNPYTDTVALYSDHPVVALHEAGHALDFSRQKWRGTYALARILPFTDLAQEHIATDMAIDYLTEIGDHRNELEAYKLLYPAYGTYVGGYMPGPFGIGSLAGVLTGHVMGRNRAREQEAFYKRLEPSTDSSTPPSAKTASQP